MVIIFTVNKRAQNGRDGKDGVDVADLHVGEAQLLHVQGDVGQEAEGACNDTIY